MAGFKQIFFFATESDLELFLKSAQAERPLKCTELGLFDKPDVESFESFTGRIGVTPGTQQFLVTEREVKLKVKLIPQEGRGNRLIVLNKFSVQIPTYAPSVVITASERYSKEVLLPGRMSTGRPDLECVPFFESLVDVMKREFLKIGSYFVGPDAERLMDEGVRLTQYPRGDPKDDLCKTSGAKEGQVRVRERKSLELTWQELEERGEEMPRDVQGNPFVPESMPNQDDEELGFSFFRAFVEQLDCSGLTLPRTYFCRSELNGVSFSNTDLHESRMCWNDFIECDFSKADLSQCDMRASTYERCNFADADMRSVDLRRTHFVDCRFEGALLTDAMVLPAEHDEQTEDGSVTQFLSAEQMTSVIFSEDAEEPDGG